MIYSLMVIETVSKIILKISIMKTEIMCCRHVYGQN